MHSKSHFMFAKLIFDMLRNEKKVQKNESWCGKLEPSSFAFRCLPACPSSTFYRLMLIMLSKGRKNNNNERAENERE